MIKPTSSPEFSHFPVMLDEVIKICSPDKGGIYIDCTFGGGGYSKKLLKFSKTKVIALDRDDCILNISKELEEKYPNRFFFYQKKFSEVDSVSDNQLVDAVIFDLGLSSIQLNNLERGFSFNSKEKLDMSMGLAATSAEEVINNFSEQTLKSIIKILGEEKDASRIVRNIIKTRLMRKITKVDQLVEIIKKSKKQNYSNKINPSTKTFQALRIFVNKEITELIKGIINATKILKPGGKILVVSFHSIEDKIVKYFFSNFFCKPI
jgi:16S rRNA (cytosine1402-N4)-methyltransferase